MFRGFRHDYAFYAKRASGSADRAGVGPRRCGSVVTAWAAASGYFYMRAAMAAAQRARLAGRRAGLTRGRRHPTELRIGDTHRLLDGAGASSRSAG